MFFIDVRMWQWFLLSMPGQLDLKWLFIQAPDAQPSVGRHLKVPVGRTLKVPPNHPAGILKGTPVMS